MKKLLTLAAALVLAPALTAAQAPDISGKWDLVVATPNGDRPGTITITKSGDKLTGSLSGPQGDMPIDVTQKDKAVTLSFAAQTQNGTLNIVMTGSVDGNTMKGDVDMGGRGSATWSAKRNAPQTPPPPAPGAPQDKPAATMTGTWAFEVTHSAGVSTPTVTITQTDGKLAGKYQSSYGQFDLTGSIKGNDFTFSVEVGTEQKVLLVYTGALDGHTVKGNVTMGEMGEGTFVGKRK